jgi:hypothetical protein
MQLDNPPHRGDDGKALPLGAISRWACRYGTSMAGRSLDKQPHRGDNEYRPAVWLRTGRVLTAR